MVHRLHTECRLTFHHAFHQPWHFRFRFSSRHRTNLCTPARSRQVPPAFAAVHRTCVRFCFIGSHRALLSFPCFRFGPSRSRDRYYGLG